MNNTLEKEKVDYTANAVKRIVLHKKGKTWMFNDENLKLVDEAFVAGSSEVLQYMIDNHPTLKNKTTPTIFFGEVLGKPDYQVFLKEDLGNSVWHTFTNKEGEVMEFWMCPAYFQFWSHAPKTFFVQFID